MVYLVGHLRGLTSLVRRAQLVVCLSVVAALAVGLSPLWSADGEGTPLALGFVRLDGTSGIVEFTSDEYLTDTVLEETSYGVPAEPRGHQLVRLTNAKRVGNGLPPLKAAAELMQSAQYHSRWMAKHDCFAHVCPNEADWVTRIVNAGYEDYQALGENIAAGYLSAGDVVAAWMNSAGHRANMLNPDFREAGGGYAYSASSYYDRYWTMDFGVRSDGQGDPVFPVVINNEAWFTNDLDVQLYVYGQGWAELMRFRNEGGTWGAWVPYQPTKAWTLSGDSGTPAVVYAQVKRGSTVLESSDSIEINPPPKVSPGQVVFLSVHGSGTTTPLEYEIAIDTSGNWSASANQTWIKLSDDSGSGDATVQVRVAGFPSGVGTYTGKIIVVAFGLPAEVDVTLAVSNGALLENHVPVSAKGQVS
jgi:uncharacterized protein YkwD